MHLSNKVIQNGHINIKIPNQFKGENITFFCAEYKEYKKHCKSGKPKPAQKHSAKHNYLGLFFLMWNHPYTLRTQR